MAQEARPLSREEKQIVSRAGFCPAMYECLGHVNDVLTIRYKNGTVIRRIDVRGKKEVP